MGNGEKDLGWAGKEEEEEDRDRKRRPEWGNERGRVVVVVVTNYLPSLGASLPRALYQHWLTTCCCLDELRQATDGCVLSRYLTTIIGYSQLL